MQIEAHNQYAAMVASREGLHSLLIDTEKMVSLLGEGMVKLRLHAILSLTLSAIALHWWDTPQAFVWGGVFLLGIYSFFVQYLPCEIRLFGASRIAARMRKDLKAIDADIANVKAKQYENFTSRP